MKNVMVVAAASVTVVGLSFALAGCGSKSGSEASSASSSSVSSSASVTSSSAAPAAAGMTINDYITKNNIAETPIKPDEPGTPNFDFPFPPGWSPAGDKTPEWAYGAIVYDKPADPSDPPTMYAIAVKLTGDVDPATVLELAPSQLQGLPEFSPIGEPNKSSLSGFDAVQYAGTYMNDGKKRVVAQKTVVIPGKDALFALQLNADALDGQQDVILDAAKVIDEQTKITAPA
ncbi:LpqN/LpqT family lipoprotein [Mycobacterium sp. CVI_P3]|uniref:LpqN/LpqT family lipoprotein n=2 Tax=Mycobacterium pinniadriaticum TaxID=2994102 RepID=UPI00224978A8|nr:LpqN/LpqT family lipoprotein [Mycobacterium pinniadriaticum]MCX2929470.1 LpqN/LpqT family lipoprotein [Mycobacterium pinniadriaticum]